ncbi:MAG TPA: hypothetical protein DDW52_18345 [Planctomycetaceae bacterium]|nr:hypothetical protein [Planctomycetaceae bacterium]
MPGITDLATLLATLRPALAKDEYVFLHCDARYGEHAELAPIASFVESEGLTLVVPRSKADAAGATYDGVFSKITLQVHSSLNAVGLTAAVATALAKHDISVNVVAAFHHDHIFVPVSRAQDAMDALSSLTGASSGEGS